MSRAWAANNPEHHKKICREWYQANKQKANRKSAQWAAAHRDYTRAYGRDYHKRNRQARSVINRNRRYLKKASGPGLTAAQWASILADHGGLCAYCPNVATDMEHVMPLIRGGEHAPWNVVPSCKACNLSKNHRTVDEWLHGVSVPRTKRP